MSELTIEAEMYLGTDSRDELYLIGPFQFSDEREQAIARLKALPGNHGDCWLSCDDRPLSVADHVIDLSRETGQPDRLDRIGCFHELLDAFEYGPGES